MHEQLVAGRVTAMLNFVEHILWDLIWVYTVCSSLFVRIHRVQVDLAHEYSTMGKIWFCQCTHAAQNFQQMTSDFFSYLFFSR